MGSDWFIAQSMIQKQNSNSAHIKALMIHSIFQSTHDQYYFYTFTLKVILKEVTKVLYEE